MTSGAALRRCRLGSRSKLCKVERVGYTPPKTFGADLLAPSAICSVIVFGEPDPPLPHRRRWNALSSTRWTHMPFALSAQVERVVLNALDTHAALPPNISAPLAVWLPSSSRGGPIHLSVRMDRQPKATLPLLHTNQQPPDSAECNSFLLRAACRVRQLAADDRNIPPARILRFCAYENVSNL